MSKSMMISGPSTELTATSALALSADLNGVDNYLSRTSDFTGAIDSKILTFAVPIYTDTDASTIRILSIGDSDGSPGGLLVYVGSGTLTVIARNSAGSTVFQFSSTEKIPRRTFGLLQASIDMDSQANCNFFLGEDEIAGTYFTFIVGQTIDLTLSDVQIGKVSNISSQLWVGRLGSLYFNHTLTNFRIENNRRLYNEISADQGLIPLPPATVVANTNPFWTAFTNPEDLTENLGSSGGTFGPELVVNGDFSNGTAGWLNSGATSQVIGGQLEVTRVSSSADATYQEFNVENGEVYAVTVQMRKGTWNATARVEAGFDSTDLHNFDIVTSTDLVGQTALVTAISTTMSVSCLVSGGNGTAYFDNVSVRKLTSGSGDLWTVNGTMRRSDGPGPNNYGAVASDLLAADYLSRASALTGAVSTKTVTAAAWYTKKDATSFPIISFGNPFKFEFRLQNGGNLYLIAYDAGGSYVFNCDQDIGLVNSARGLIVVELDTSPTMTGWVRIDGGDAIAITFSGSPDDADILLDQSPVGINSRNGGSGAICEVGSVWLDDTLVGLETSNPFWDSDLNRPKYPGENGERITGSQPLMFLPIRGDDAGNNLGSGGDFIVNSGPFTGARGASEVWKPTGNFNGTTQYETRGTLDGIADGKQATLVLAFRRDNTATSNVFGIRSSTNNHVLRVNINSGTPSGNFNVSAKNAANAQILNLNSVETATNGEWNIYMLAVDLSTTTVYQVINNVLDTGTPSTITNDDMAFATSGDVVMIGVDQSGTGGFHNGDIGFLWFDTVFVDFSDEAETLKWIDALLYPREIGVDGSLPTESQPIIYMSEDFHLGTNFGTGGDFTPIASPSRGADVGGI